MKTGQAISIRTPQLVESPMTKRIYIVTKGTMIPRADGTLSIAARQKYDITNQFKALAGKLFEEQVAALRADMEKARAQKVENGQV